LTPRVKPSNRRSRSPWPPQAEREAAENRALALRVEADAKKAAALAEAEGISAINEAKNRLGAAQIDLAVRLQLIQSLPLIIQQSVKPLEKIESIRLFQVNGMPTGQRQPGCGSGRRLRRRRHLAEQVVNSALQYQVAKPIVDAIMKDAGLSNPSLTGLPSRWPPWWPCRCRWSRGASADAEPKA
jgi:uncharacterized membrane protein YqiK